MGFPMSKWPFNSLLDCTTVLVLYICFLQYLKILTQKKTIHLLLLLFQCKKNQVLNLYMVFTKLYTNYLPTLSLSHLFCSCCITFCISDREFTFEFSNEKCTNVIGLFLHSKEGTIF